MPICKLDSGMLQPIATGNDPMFHFIDFEGRTLFTDLKESPPGATSETPIIIDNLTGMPLNNVSSPPLDSCNASTPPSKVGMLCTDVALVEIVCNEITCYDFMSTFAVSACSGHSISEGHSIVAQKETYTGRERTVESREGGAESSTGEREGGEGKRKSGKGERKSREEGAKGE